MLGEFVQYFAEDKEIHELGFCDTCGFFAEFVSPWAQPFESRNCLRGYCETGLQIIEI